MRHPRPLLLLALVLIPALPATAEAKRLVPKGWLGTVLADPAVLSSTPRITSEAGVMAASGVESVRFPLYWSQAQPYRRLAEVPANDRARFRTGRGGIPTELST